VAGFQQSRQVDAQDSKLSELPSAARFEHTQRDRLTRGSVPGRTDHI
jgi:hypothetical protein